MKNKIKQIWRQYATPIVSIPIGLFIIGFGGIRNGLPGAFICGGLFLLVGIISLFIKDTKI